MTFTIEVLPKSMQHPIVQQIRYEGNEPALWTDQDVGEVLRLMLLAFDRASNPASGDGERPVALRGMSWIVTPHDAGGSVIAVEIHSGAIAAGPFAIEAPRLEAMVERVLSGSGSETVH